VVTIHYQDDWLTVYHGDCKAVMAEMEPESVHCVVTSPPYWGLRDYGTPGQLGLEPTPEEYVANLVAVFREVRRVLRADGTVWLNLGDSYTSGGRKTRDPGQSKIHPALENWTGGRADNPAGLKPKDLVGIPWRVAFALQADGWYLRSDIIWSKPNPMPESVTDRPTKSHEYIFLLSKSPRYYFDADAVAEGVTDSTVARLSQPTLDSQAGSDRVPGKTNGPMKAVGKLTGGAYSPPGQAPHSNARSDHMNGTPRNDGDRWRTIDGGVAERGSRNIRTVWTVATQPYAGAHFATFPPKLIEPCIKAGCPEGGIVLDPFAGSGTTGMVAQFLSRRAVLIDLSLDYLGQLMRRNADIPLGIGA